MKTNSENEKEINNYVDSFTASFLGNEKTRDAATQIIESLKYSDDIMKEINEIAASFKDSKE
jgi:hypothetical protein